jgi:hypothetical protein
VCDSFNDTCRIQELELVRSNNITLPQVRTLQELVKTPSLRTLVLEQVYFADEEAAVAMVRAVAESCVVKLKITHGHHLAADAFVVDLALALKCTGLRELEVFGTTLCPIKLSVPFCRELAASV